MHLPPRFLDLLYPFWQRAPRWLRRALIWFGSDKFLVGVAAICLNPHGEMLLLDHRFHPETPWGLPGGWVDRGETPLACLVREVREETGLEPIRARLLHVDSDGTWVEVVYVCQVPDVEPTVQVAELRGYRWVDPLAFEERLTESQRRAIEVFRQSHQG